MLDASKAFDRVRYCLIGRFYHDKSTKTLYKYSHDRLEIKDIRCIHQGIERKKKDCKLFNELLERNISPVVLRILIYMYMNQTLRVQ